MLRPCKFIVIPASVWDDKRLSLLEKAAMVELFSFADENHVAQMAMSTLAKRLSAAIADTKKAVERLSELDLLRHSKGHGEHFMLLDSRTTFSADDTPAESEQESDQIDYDGIVEAWTASNPMAITPRITYNTRKKIRTCLKKNKLLAEDLTKVFQIVAASDFLSGRKTSWRATFDWIISDRKECIKRILDGEFNQSPLEMAAYLDILKPNQPKANNYE